MSKVVDLKEYKKDKKLQKWIAELDQIIESQYDDLSDVEKKGAANFRKLLTAVSKQSVKDITEKN